MLALWATSLRDAKQRMRPCSRGTGGSFGEPVLDALLARQVGCGRKRLGIAARGYTKLRSAGDSVYGVGDLEMMLCRAGKGDVLGVYAKLH